MTLFWMQMLESLVIVVIALLAVALGFQWLWCQQFVSLFRGPKSPSVADEQLPKVALVMTLRGADPFLDRTLQGLTQLDYPSYDIRIVVDHKEDPAWELVQRIIIERGCRNVKVEELSDRRTTCSLRMSSLIQAVSGLDDSYGAVAIIDADVVTYPDWLRDMVSPLVVDPDVGATTGVRWFIPEESNPGSLVRYVWNAAAIAQMHAFGIGWGGSLALRTSLLRETGMLEKWSQIMFEDTFTVNEVHLLGKKLKYVPEATMSNRESIDVAGCTKFISRQVLNARMYHRSWPAIAAYALVSAIGFNGALAVGAATLLLGHTAGAAAIGAAFGLYALGMGWLLILTELTCRQGAQQRGESIPALSWKLLGSGFLTHYVYLASVLMALRVKEIEWRGIRYTLGGPRKVSLLQYSPYRPRFAAQDARASL
ncbi:MAG TPA: glycosyltransferase family 2 protein [Planctomycetaceae bacterium]